MLVILEAVHAFGKLVLIIRELYNESNNRFKLNLYARIKCEANLIFAKLPGWSDIRIIEKLQLIKFPQNSVKILSSLLLPK